MMTLSVVAALLGASCSAFAPKSLRGTPRRTAKRQSLQMNVITDRPARAALAAAYDEASGWLAEMARFFESKLSEANLRNVMKQATALATTTMKTTSTWGINVIVVAVTPHHIHIHIHPSPSYSPSFSSYLITLSRYQYYHFIRRFTNPPIRSGVEVGPDNYG